MRPHQADVRGGGRNGNLAPGSGRGVRRRRLGNLLSQMQEQQNEYQRIKWGSVRVIHDWDLLLFEHALRCLLSPAHANGHCAYHLARDYAERYSPSEGTGLTSSSVPFLQDIVDFWIEEFDLDAAAVVAAGWQKQA